MLSRISVCLKGKKNTLDYTSVFFLRFNLSYSFNTGTTLTAHKDVYIVAQLDSPTTAKLATAVAPIT